MKRRSNLAIVICELNRLHKQSGERFCILSHGPEPMEGNNWKFRDNSIYDITILADILPKVELEYGERAYSSVAKRYKYWVDQYQSTTKDFKP